MDSLYLLQFGCFLFMLINAAYLVLGSLHTQWQNKRYEHSRNLIVVALAILAFQYYLQMSLGLRATDDAYGALLNVLVYPLSFSLISIAIYHIEATHSRRRKMLESMAATDLLPYVRYSKASLFILFTAALVMPIAIISTQLLLIVGPLVLIALFFFIVTFMALGNNYVPSDELLDKDEEQEGELSPEEKPVMATLSDETKQQIEKKLEAWCAEKGYKDTAMNLLMLSRQLEVSKSDLSLYFDQCIESSFRIWLSDIRFEAAKKMMREKTSYSNDVISLECGFSSRSQLYRIFNSKVGCSPQIWRNKR